MDRLDTSMNSGKLRLPEDSSKILLELRIRDILFRGTWLLSINTQ